MLGEKSVRDVVQVGALVVIALGATSCLQDRPSGHSQATAPPPDASPSDAHRPTPVACTALPELVLPHVTVDEAHLVPGGSAGARSLPAYCRVMGVSRPTSDSEIRFELAVPVGEAWNGRYLQVGNGAFAGRIPEADILEGLASGYAVSGTDDGHQAGPADVSWALGHPEKVVDFGYRAVKETCDAARAILGVHTGQSPKFSYFTGCSDGGREGLMEAQRYPEDFDGIVVGAPTIATTHVLFGFAWNVRVMLQTRGSYVSRAKLTAIEAAAIKSCGNVDGVIDDPLACHFDPSVLRCTGAENDRCLTGPEIDALRKIYAGPHNPRTGDLVAPGFEPGGEAEPAGPGPDGWAFWIAGSAPGAAGRSGDFQLSSNFFRYMVRGDPSYDLAGLDFDEDVATTDAKLAAILNPDNPDLAGFAKRGGKLLHYQGWSDAVISPRSSIAYFDRVNAAMGDTRSFYRLFMAPGMCHCEGGRGPNVLPTLATISAWVEHGKAPDQLVATKFVDDSPTKAVDRTQPICPYPQRASWNGRGDPKQADSYRCAD
jgi:hypothetical protein